jgi:hypothetical protein
MLQQPKDVSHSKARRPWRLRFRLASLLWLMLCVAVGITAYRAGVEATRRELWHNRNAVGSMYVATYYVADLVCPSTAPPAVDKPGSVNVLGQTGVIADFDSLTDEIEATVFPRTWTSAGGSASVSGFPTNLSIVVSHDKDGHEEVARFLAAKRKANPASQIDERGNPLDNKISSTK